MPEPDSLANPEIRKLGVERLGAGVAALERLFGLSLPGAPGPVPPAALDAPEAADPDVHHMHLSEALLPGFDRARDGWQGLARAQADLLPDLPAVARIDARAAALFGQPEGDLVARARALFTLVEQDAAGLAAGGGDLRHVHARENHGYWEHFTHSGLVAGADPRLALFLGRRRPYLERYLPVTRRYRACGFLRLHLAALRRLAGLADAGAAATARQVTLATPDLSLGVGLYNGDVRFCRTLAQPLAPVPRGALPGLLACFEAVFPAARNIRLTDGALTRQILLERGLQAFVAAATREADAILFVVPPHLRRITLAGAGTPHYRCLVPGTRVHELWPAVLALLLGHARALFARHARLTVFVQAGSMGLPIVAALHGLAQDRPGLALRCYDLGQVLDTADPALVSGGRLARHAAVVAGQRLPFGLQAPEAQPRA